jgi:hypothetical protein
MAFTNRNTCKNFTITGLTKAQLSAAECTEIMFSVPAGQTLTLFSENDSTIGFTVVGASVGSTVFTYSGMSNASELSATCGTGITYRTKYFANYNLAVQM